MKKSFFFILFSIGIGFQTLAQDQTMIQIKAMNKQLQPYPRIKISINNGENNKLDDSGVIFVEIANKDLPPKLIEVVDENLEVESWNFSKGILEIIIRPKTHEHITVAINDEQNRPVPGVKVSFQLSESFSAVSDANGIVSLSIPIKEKLNNSTRIVVEGYQLLDKKFSKDQGYLVVNPISRVESKSIRSHAGLKKPVEDVKVIDEFQSFNFDYLDSINSLTVFYAVIKNIDIENFDDETTRRIDAKFYQLIRGLEGSLDSLKSESFLTKISDSSLVQHDVSILIEQALAENQSLARIRNEFDANVEILNGKLKDGKNTLSQEEKRIIVDRISRLTKILAENEDKFYQNQAHFKETLVALGIRLQIVNELREQLAISEHQREMDSKDLNRKLLTAIIISLVLAVFGIISFLLLKKFKKQKNELKKANVEVKRVNENLEEMVSERTMQLQKSNEELDTFLYKSSHDLRRPLTSIVGLSNIARLTMNQESYELFERAAKTARQMDKMLKKLINISEINHPSTYASIDFDLLIQGVIDGFSELIVDKNISVQTTVQPSIDFRSHPELIEIVVTNLIENALWFSSLNQDTSLPKVNIDVIKQNGHVSINLSDNGPGIDPAIRDDIWKMFFVGHEQSPGNGLGLYVTNKAVETLNGKIQFQSNEKGFTCFEVKLPVNGED